MIGVDVGGTKMLGVVVDEAGAVLGEARRDTPVGGRSLIEGLLSLVAVLDDGGPVGIGVPGLVDRAGHLHRAPNLRDFEPVAVGELLAARLGRPVTVDNDATCATLAEWRLGAGRGVDDLLMVTLGTGIGGGMVAGARLQRGARGFAGELGHMVVDPDGPACVCGKRGCWERFASGSGLAALGGRPGEQVVRVARAGDAEALAAIAAFRHWVALGLANLVNVLDPAVIVIGGGLVADADLLIDPLAPLLADQLYGHFAARVPEIRVAALGERAGAIGAALAARL